jgi:hypothetical protein
MNKVATRASGIASVGASRRYAFIFRPTPRLFNVIASPVHFVIDENAIVG